MGRLLDTLFYETRWRCLLCKSQPTWPERVLTHEVGYARRGFYTALCCPKCRIVLAKKCNKGKAREHSAVRHYGEKIRGAKYGQVTEHYEHGES